MSQAHLRPRAHARHFTLNTDGRRHPYLNTAISYTILGGLASFILGMATHQHLAGAILGVSGFVTGIWAQLVSATREERIFTVFGIVASFVGMGLAFAHGGFGY